MEFKLKNAKKDDLKKIEILGDNNLEFKNVYRKDYLNYLIETKNIIIQKLEINKKIIGVIIYKLVYSEDRIHIIYLVIDKSYRNNGLGSKTLDKIKNRTFSYNNKCYKFNEYAITCNRDSRVLLDIHKDDNMRKS